MLVFENPFPKEWLDSSKLEEENTKFKKFFQDLIDEHKPHDIKIEYVVRGPEGDKDKPNKERFIGFSRGAARFFVHVNVDNEKTKYKFPVSQGEFTPWKTPISWNKDAGFAIGVTEVEKIIFYFDQSSPNKKKSGVLENYAND